MEDFKSDILQLTQLVKILAPTSMPPTPPRNVVHLRTSNDAKRRRELQLRSILDDAAITENIEKYKALEKSFKDFQENPLIALKVATTDEFDEDVNLVALSKDLEIQQLVVDKLQ
ncbi:hypothetical protein L6452_06274 [Arctium lappa]|uniref:Uncharacterized protein n=1 Tax=Arctium lappa TaxID=4217 RepID=A0ACB9EJD8_ARCLA|nr:hypothetical protein L6452_06274 [Arctium lappa]